MWGPRRTMVILLGPETRQAKVDAAQPRKMRSDVLQPEVRSAHPRLTKPMGSLCVTAILLRSSDDLRRALDDVVGSADNLA